jgi:membrane protease YdiL (CAAX protease family)
MTPESPISELPLPTPPRREPAWNVGDLLLILVVAFFSLIAAGAVGIAATHAIPQLQGFSKEQIATNPLFFIPVQLVAYLITFIFTRMLITVRAQQDFWSAVKWNFPAASDAFTYVFAGVVMAFVAQIAGHFLPIPKSLPMDRYFREPAFAYLLMAFGVLVAPLVEELLFRGLIFPLAARTLGVIGGTVLTALLFSLVHQSQLAQAWAPLLVIFGVGLVLTTIRARTNSLAASWIVHFSYNATLFAVLFYLTSGFKHLERLAE